MVEKHRNLEKIEETEVCESVPDVGTGTEGPSPDSLPLSSSSSDVIAYPVPVLASIFP